MKALGTSETSVNVYDNIPQESFSVIRTVTDFAAMITNMMFRDLCTVQEIYTAKNHVEEIS
jgi:Holliday junction resolvasome RuvABC ATP-dependent DNA helicase subunit